MADVAIALYNPHKLGDTSNLGYDVQSFVDDKGYNKYRSAYVLKNSYGIDDIGYGFKFLGGIGKMTELPKPEDINYQKL